MDRWYELLAGMRQEERLRDAEQYRQAQLVLAPAEQDASWRGRAFARLQDLLDTLAERILDDIASYPVRTGTRTRLGITNTCDERGR